MITTMRRCVACDDLWPWPISSRSLDHVLPWDPTWLNRVGNHEAAGVSSERRRSSWIRDIHNWDMDIHDYLMDVNIQLWMSTIEFWIYIITNNDHGLSLWSSKTQLWISMIRVCVRVWLSVFNAPPDSPNLLLFYPFHTFFLLYPHPTPPHPKRSWRGVHWFHLARLSICPYVGRIVPAVYHPQY